MREALFICPTKDNDGADLTGIRDEAISQLCSCFGGCSVRPAYGTWCGPDGKVYQEDVWELVAAYEPTDSNDSILRGIATRTGVKGKQLAVYVRLGSGEVEILDLRPLLKANAA